MLFSDCPKGHANEPACTEANALIFAHYVKPVKDRTKYEWVFIIDDDVLVFPQKLAEILKNKNDSNVYGFPGCLVDMTKYRLKAQEVIAGSYSIFNTY